MQKHFPLFLFLILTLLSCSNFNTKTDIARWKSEISKTEQDFNDMAQEKGLAEAFYHFAANDGVIKRGNSLVKGKNVIREWVENNQRANETLSWKPTFIDVSSSGDLAYTYGDFVFTFIDSTGQKKINKGIFHTVWKRQDDGTWKFVWD